MGKPVGEFDTKPQKPIVSQNAVKNQLVTKTDHNYLALYSVWFILQICILQGAVSIPLFRYTLDEILLFLHAVVVCSGWAFCRINGVWGTWTVLAC